MDVGLKTSFCQDGEVGSYNCLWVSTVVIALITAIKRSGSYRVLTMWRFGYGLWRRLASLERLEQYWRLGS